ncbi:MAG: TolC family protein [Spirochaetes bacterium]|nr:TolC family protein [Spirochaetota bacterium]
MKKNTLILFLFLFFQLNNSLYSELRKVSLNECINIAIQNHPEIKAADEDSNYARSNYKVAKARNSPIINFEIKTVENKIVDENGNRIEPSNGVIDIPGKDTMIGLYAGPTLVYNLVDPQASSIIDSAKLSIDLAKMKGLKARYDTVLNVKKNYYEYLFASENRSKREQLVQKFQTKLEKANLLFKSGQRPILDVTKAEVDLADARLEFEKARNYESIIKTELLSSMGIMDDNIEFSPIKIEKLPKLRFPLGKIYKLAEIYNADLKIAILAKEINRLNIDVANAAHYPVVDLLGAIGVENTTIFRNWENPFNDRDEFQEKVSSDKWGKTIGLGITAKFNLWAGGGIKAKADAKLAEYNKSKYFEQQLLIKMKSMIKKYFQSINEFEKQFELSELVIKNSQKHLTLARKSYENGISTQLEMQDAELTLLKSELGFINAGYEYLILLAKLANVVGLGEEYICLE